MPRIRRTPALKHALMLGAPLWLSACAYTHGITPQEQAIQDQVEVGQYMPATREMRDNIETQELFAQAAFWSHEYDLNPADLEATLKLAAAVRKLGNPSRAVEITQTSRQLHPRDPYLLAEHAAGLIADQRSMDALPVLEDGLRIAPGYGRLWSLRGAALDQVENYEAARQSYNRALQITPNDPNVLTNLGLSYALSGDLQSAEGWLRRAVNLPGSGPSARENLALVLQLQGRTEEAQRHARIAGQSQPDRKLPPAPVPALTPRGAPAQLSPGRAAPAYQARPSQVPPQMQTPAQAAPRPWGEQMAGMPSTRLTTVAPNGQAFTSSSQAARQAGTVNPLSQYETAPQRPSYGQTAQPAQQDVLGSIRQSLQPRAVTPQTQYAAPGAPQPYVVGQGSLQGAPQGGTVPMPQATTPQAGYPQYAAPAAEPSRRDPARRRR